MSLDELEKVSLRDEWDDEEKDFTPWIAENIEKIEEVLGMKLEVKDTEQPVGKFNADILAQGPREEKEVIIENQLEKSDHKHLGQLITYGSGVEAFTVIWICKNLRDEHRNAIKWLNESTRKDTNFLALEIELYKIGDSNPAPQFDVVAEPNEWSQNVKSLTESLSESDELKLSYWSEFKSHLEESDPPFSLRTPTKRHYYGISIGRSHFEINCKIKQSEEKIAVELYFDPNNSGQYYEMLKDNQKQIESEIGSDLEWKKLQGTGACRIIKYNTSVNIENSDNWSKQFNWLEDTLYSFYNVFSYRVNNLELEK